MKETRVLGHLNCTPEECNSCANVACGIQQGWEKAIPIEVEVDSKKPLKEHVVGHPNCAPQDCENCHNMSCEVHLGYAEAVSVETSTDTLPLARKGHIKGHPNCIPGECDEGTCKDVSCGIHQGYETPEFVYDEEEAPTAN